MDACIFYSSLSYVLLFRKVITPLEIGVDAVVGQPVSCYRAEHLPNPCSSPGRMSRCMARLGCSRPRTHGCRTSCRSAPCEPLACCASDGYERGRGLLLGLCGFSCAILSVSACVDADRPNSTFTAVLTRVECERRRCSTRYFDAVRNSAISSSDRCPPR